MIKTVLVQFLYYPSKLNIHSFFLVYIQLFQFFNDISILIKVSLNLDTTIDFMVVLNTFFVFSLSHIALHINIFYTIFEDIIHFYTHTHIYINCYLFSNYF